MIVSPLDAPALLLVGAAVAFAYRRRLCRHNPDWFPVLGAAAVVVFWADLLLAGVVGATPWGLAPVVETTSAVLAVFYALSYPLWFLVGARTVFLFLGRRPAEGGVLWVYRIEDDTEEFDPSWES